MEKKLKFIYKDDLCNAKWRKKSLKCYLGVLHLTGNNKQDFQLYYAWCKGCDKIKVVERKELLKAAKGFVKAVSKVLEED